MKQKITITGPKVHDVGYRYFLMGGALSRGIKMFEAYNSEGGPEEEVIALVAGGEKEIAAFRTFAESKRPDRASLSRIVFDDYDGEVMRISEYAQICTAVQLNKAIPVLLDLSDDMKSVRGDMKSVKDDMKAVRKNTDVLPQIHEEIKGLREDIQPGFAIQFRQM